MLEKAEAGTVGRKDAVLSLYAYGRDAGMGSPAILFLHGYPDDHSIFHAAISKLSLDRTVIAYDTRNAGASSVANGGTSSYRLPVLVDDLFAVIEASGKSPVHLVGHDWGSIQGWAAVQDKRTHGQILSFTSISGPDLGHLRRWFRRRLRKPTLWPQALGQLLRSSYVVGFQLPALPELVWRRYLTRRYERITGRNIGDNGARGLALYRANWFHGHHLPTSCLVPVQVIIPRRDPFLSPHLVDGLDEWVPRLSMVEVDAGHWWPAEDGESLAQILRAWIVDVERKQREAG